MSVCHIPLYIIVKKGQIFLQKCIRIKLTIINNPLKKWEKDLNKHIIFSLTENWYSVIFRYSN